MEQPQMPLEPPPPDYEPPPPPRGGDPPPELVEEPTREPPREPPPELVEALQLYFTQKRVDLLRQVQEIETFLGFIEVSGGLAERVAKLELFLGLKG